MSVIVDMKKITENKKSSKKHKKVKFFLYCES